MKRPPDFLLPFLHSVESMVLQYNRENRVDDRMIGMCYEKLKDYYKKISFGKEIEEPYVNSNRVQGLIDVILDIIDLRENIDADIVFINNPNYIFFENRTIKSLAEFYSVGFGILSKSVRFWKKERGTSYLKFISEHVI